MKPLGEPVREETNKKKCARISSVLPPNRLLFSFTMG